MAKPKPVLQRCRTANCTRRQEGQYCAQHDPNPPVVEAPVEAAVEAEAPETTTSKRGS